MTLINIARKRKLRYMPARAKVRKRFGCPVNDMCNIVYKASCTYRFVEYQLHYFIQRWYAKFKSTREC